MKEVRFASDAGCRAGNCWPIGIGGGCVALYLMSDVGSPTVYFALVAKRPGTCLGMPGQDMIGSYLGGGYDGCFGLGGGEALAGAGTEIWFGGITSAGVSAQPSAPE